METLNNVNLSFNFNLRKPKQSKATPLYLVVNIGTKQMKLSTGMKVLPVMWNSKRQECDIMGCLGENERMIAISVNSMIYDLRSQCNEIMNYLCSGETVVNTEQFIRDSIKINADMANSNPKPRTRTASKIIVEAFEIYYQNRQTKPQSVYAERSKLNVFIDYAKNNGDSPKHLTQNGLNDFRQWLIDTAISGEHKRSAKTINGFGTQLARLINDVLCVHKNFRSFGFSPVRFTNVEDGRTRQEYKRRPLTDAEVDAIAHCQGLTDKESECRDLFLMEINTGVRVSDLHKFFIGEYEIKYMDGEKTYRIKTQKRGTTATIISNETIETIRERYADGFKAVNILDKKFKTNQYNDNIKRVCKKAALNSIEKFSDNIAGKNIEKQAMLWEIIGSHYARYTFITNKLREDYTPDEVCIMSGHSDDQMVKTIYGQLTQDDKDNKLMEARKRIKRIKQTPASTDDDGKIIAEQARQNYKLQQQIDNANLLRELNKEKALIIDIISDNVRLIRKGAESNGELSPNVIELFNQMELFIDLEPDTALSVYESLFGSYPTIDEYRDMREQGICLMNRFGDGSLKFIM